ncbi:MAG: hypothetical protein D6719_13185, partial [Candidatus Dadabacteria bacterium]
ASGGNSELISDCQTGLLVPTANAEVLAEKLFTIYSDRQLANSLSEQAYRNVKSSFGLKNTVDQMEAMYLSVLRGPP